MPPTAPDSSAAQIITALSWWTVVSPAAVLAATVLCARRPRLRGALTAAALLPALLTLLPVAVMHGGLAAAAASAGALSVGAAIALSATGLWHAPAGRTEARAAAALVTGVAGGMAGAVGLFLARLLS